MNNLVYEIANQPLNPGDRVVFTSNDRLHFGIVDKVNPQKTTIRMTDSSFTLLETNSAFYMGKVPIENRKIYKLNI